MSRIDIVRTDVAMPDSGKLEVVRTFLFQCLDGLGNDDRRSWRKFWKRITTMEPGEFVRAEMWFPRSGPFHRRHMKIEASIFDAQDRFDDFEMFRDWLKIGAAWVVWVPGPKGGIVPLPRSISYAKADQDEFEKYHAAVMNFLRGEHAAPYLWKHLGERSHDMMNTILDGFGE